MLDFTIYTYNQIAGRTDPGMPELFTGLPARRAARGREQDRLVLYLSFEGSSGLPPEVQREFLEKLTSVFYNTPGTVTYALKAVVSQLNDRLLARNLRSRDGSSAIGLFQACVLHDGTFFVAQSGPTHTYFISGSSVQHFYEAEDAGRGLGSSRTPAFRFYRTELKSGDQILLCANPPADWTEGKLSTLNRLSLGQVRSRLTAAAGGNLRFLLLLAEKGRGLLPVRSLQEVPEETLPQADSSSRSRPAVPPAAAPGTPAGITLAGEQITADQEPPSTPLAESGEKVAGLFAGLLAGRQKPEPPADRPAPNTDIPQPAPENEFTVSPNERSIPAAAPLSEPWSPDSGEPDFSAPSAPVAPPLTGKAPRRSSSRKTRATLAAGLRGWRGFKQRAGSNLSTFFSRILPGQADKLPGMSPGTLVFIAVAVPLIIVAAATTVYIQTGRGQQRDIFLAQSLEAVAQAQAQTDPVLQRVNYEAALDWAKKAEEYGATDQSAALKAQISGAIDAMDGITRFELHPALPTDFDRGVSISQIWASQTEDLYLLDSANGRILRMVYTRPGYEVDPQFTCGPGMIGGLIIGPLVDFVLAPSGNSFNAVVLAVDGGGNLLYCSLNPTKTAAVTLPPPDAGWGKIQAVAYQSGVLSILDPQGNAVWRYEGFGLDFSSKPRLFFDNVVPNLSGAVDLAVYLDDLYVLSQDGHMVICTYSNVGVTPTRCTDPYPYRVAAGGQPAQELVSMNAQFTQMQATQPPEPSLYFLDSSGKAVYQFSMSLNFVRRLQPTANGDNPLPAAAPTALAVTGGRNLVVAYDNRVFIAVMPAP